MDYLAGELRWEQSGDLCIGFEFLRAVPHRFVARVGKVTPSGRQQSAVLIVLEDALLLCSHRGGLHRHIQLARVHSVALHAHGRVVFRVRGEHDLLIAAPHAQRLILVLVQLINTQGLTSLAVEYHEEQQALPQTLSLRPSTSYVSTVPASLQHALRTARVALAKKDCERARSAMTGMWQKPEEGTSSGAGADSTRHAQHDGAMSRSLLDIARPDVSLSASQPSKCDGGGASGGWCADADEGTLKGATAMMDAARRAAGNQLSPRIFSTGLDVDTVRGGGSQRSLVPVVSPKRTGMDQVLPLGADDLTIHVVENGASLVTFPCIVSVWRYLRYICKHLPGAQQAPCATVANLEPPVELDGSAAANSAGVPSLTINVTLLFQTMALAARQMPHIVTFQRTAGAEGVHLDSGAFWQPANELSVS